MKPLSAWRIGLLSMQLKQSAVIAYPTEGVWGLGCLPDSVTGVSRILALKKRAWDKGLILVAGSMAQIEPYLAGMTDAEIELLKSYWPGATTFLIPDNGYASSWVVGKHPTVALRVSAHPVIQQLCEAVGGPIVSTSANVSDRPAALSALDVRRHFGDQLDYVVPGSLGGNDGASEIRELATGRIVRAGA